MKHLLRAVAEMKTIMIKPPIQGNWGAIHWFYRKKFEHYCVRRNRNGKKQPGLFALPILPNDYLTNQGKPLKKAKKNQGLVNN